MLRCFPIMDIHSWDDLRVLLAVHREQSFLGAGKVLGLSTSTTARRIDALEAALGRKLVKRSRSGAELEPEALRLIRLAEALQHGLDVERRDARSTAGTVKVSVPEGTVREVAQALLALRRDHPDTDIELLGENRMSDIAKREADIGLRITRSTSSVLVEKHIATLRFGIFASAEYARRHLPGARLRKGDAARHPFIGLDRRWEGLPHEQWMRALGATRFPFRSSSVVAIVEAAHQGVGLAALVDQVGRNAELVRIDVPLPGPTQPIYLVYHRELRNVPRIKAVVAAITEHTRAYG
jgi:DNA-binding transcriptional LysR family regulator